MRIRPSNERMDSTIALWRAKVVVKPSKRIKYDEKKLAAPEVKVRMGMKVEVLIVLESMCMQGGNANVVSIKLRVT